MTVKQRQLLLTYLGYDPGSIDGADGPRTRAALTEFQQDAGITADGIGGSSTDASLILAVRDGRFREENAADFWGTIFHFRREEFRCPCGKCGGFPAEPREKLVRLAEKVREHFGAPAIISSGVRCRAHNAEVGGVANSRHLLGQAVDLTVRGVPADQVTAYAAGLPECAYTYSITSGGKPTGYVHMDVVL